MSDYDYSIDVNVDCGPVGKYSTEGYGLYQYVAERSDGSGTSYLVATICRSGALFNTYPTCPYDACIGGGAGDCSQCYDWKQ